MPVGYKAIDEWMSVDCSTQIFAYAFWLLGDCNCHCAEMSLDDGPNCFFLSDLIFLSRDLL
jgi:hypothetical protein